MGRDLRYRHAMTHSADFHDYYLDAWNRATASGNKAELDPFIADDYHGWVGHDAVRVDPFTNAEAHDGFTQAIAALRGTTVHAEHRTIGRRGDDEAIVFYELSYRSGDAVLARAALLESWRRSDDGRWKLHRDLTEHSVEL